MKKAYLLIILFLCGLSVGNLFASASAAAAEEAAAPDLGQELIDAAIDGEKAKIEELIAAGADVNAVDHGGYTALIWAAISNYENIVDQLLQAGADVNARDDAGFTALMYAAINGDADIVQKLLDMGADKDIQNVDGETAEAIARDARYDGHNELADMIRDYVRGRHIKSAGKR